jgi:hypothetical protein
MSALLGAVVLVRLVRLCVRQAWCDLGVLRLGIGEREDAAAVYPRFEDRSEHAGQGKL